jgi:hypothetical protein
MDITFSPPEPKLRYGIIVQNNPVNFVDRTGQSPIHVAGALIGMGVNAYKNYNAYESGQMSGSAYVGSIAIGGLTGLISSFGGGVLSGAAWGGVGAFLNDVGDQYLTNACGQMNWKNSLKTGALGLAAGAIAGEGFKTGHILLHDLNPKGKWGTGAPNYGELGGIIGNVVGTLLTY